MEKEKEFSKHQKSLLAKEICAFLNTSDGIIAWGIEYSETNGIKISNDYNGNLYELLDLCIQTIVEPTPSGIDFKIIEEDNKNALIIFIPKSNTMPHRVWGETVRINAIITLGPVQIAFRLMKAQFEHYIVLMVISQEFLFLLNRESCLMITYP